jgi:hypothetical protein
MGAAIDHAAGGPGLYTGEVQTASIGGASPDYWGQFWATAGQSVTSGLNRWIDNEVRQATSGGQPDPNIAGGAPTPQGRYVVAGVDLASPIVLAIVAVAAMIVIPKLTR